MLLTIGAVLFFVVKAILGYVTYRHDDRRLNAIEEKLEALAAKRIIR